MRYKAILLDADDTIFDFQSAERAALKLTMAPYGLDSEEHIQVYHKINLNYWKALERGEVSQSQLRVLRHKDFLEHYGMKANYEAVASAYSKHLSEQSMLFDGALMVVRQLADVLPIAIVTNGIAEVQRGRMSRSPINDMISALVISEEVGAAKPDPRLLLVALEQLGGIQPEDALMVGDSVTSDIAAANAAGIDACWYNPHNKPLPDGMHVEYCISSIRDLLSIALA